MIQRLHWTRLTISGLTLLALFAGSEARAQDVKPPEFKHAMDVKVRKPGEKGWEKATKTGIEVFFDPNSNHLVYATETGSIAVAAAPPKFEGKPKDPVWSHGMELKVRKAGEDVFSEKTEKVGVEVYHDPSHGNLIYITDKGTIAVVPGKAVERGKEKDPDWSHAMEIAVRKAGEKEFTDKTRKFGVEAYYDPNGGNLVYISDVGAITVQPGTKVTEAKGKNPKWKAGMELRIRKANEKYFDKDTVKHGVEVYSDENNGKLIFLSESGALGSLPGPAPADPKKDPQWVYGLTISARKAGEKEFDNALKIGIEVYTHDGTNAAIYATDRSNLSVVPK
jgi:hypothetical protein